MQPEASLGACDTQEIANNHHMAELEVKTVDHLH